MTTEQALFGELRLDSPLHTMQSHDTVEQRGKATIEAIKGVPLFRDRHAVAASLESARDKIDRAAFCGTEFSLNIGETLAVYLEVFERQAHEDLMADRITYRAYSNRLTRLQKKIMESYR